MLSKLLPVFIIIIFLLFILFYFRTDNEEHFQIGDVKINQKKNKNFELDEYTLTDGFKTLKIEGVWNFDKKDIYIMDGKKKVSIKKNRNVYEFIDSHNHDIIFNYGRPCGDIIINNHSDDLFYCPKEKVFKRGSSSSSSDNSKEIAKIVEINNNIFKINIKDKSAEKYIEIFFVVFSVFNQIQKELTIDLDNIL